MHDGPRILDAQNQVNTLSVSFALIIVRSIASPFQVNSVNKVASLSVNTLSEAVFIGN